MPDSALPDATVLTSAFYETYLRQQVIVTCTSATRPTGVEGRRIFETDTELEYVYTGAAWIAMGNAGPWTSFTPTLTQSATVTKTVNRGHYVRAGRSVIGESVMTCSSSGTAANNVVVGLPVAAATATNNTVMGEGFVYDASANFFYFGVLLRDTGTTATFLRRTDAAAAGYIGSSGFTAALTTSDIISYYFQYEANA